MGEFRVEASPLTRLLLLCLSEAVGQGVTEVTQDSLAAAAGRKITASFRKRMAELEARGIVSRYMYPSGKIGGYKVAYAINVEAIKSVKVVD